MRRTQGFTMLELMVATALGLLLSAAAIQLFLANQVSLNFQRGMNDVQANGRFIIDQITRDVRMAGLGSVTESGTNNGSAGLPFTVDQIANLATIAPTSTALNRNGFATTGAVNGLLTDSDQLVVQYMALNAIVDCEGNNVAAGRVMVARYFVREDNGQSTLACDGGSHNGSADLQSYGDNGAALLSGVDSFQVLYGVDDRIVSGTTNSQAQIARYLTAAQYMALAAPRPTILSVRLGLYMRSQERAGNASPPAADITVLDTTIPVADVPTDGRLRRLFINTITLRNLDLSGV